MKFIKTVENLFNKALVTGEANLNGRQSYYNYFGWEKGDIEEKYNITVQGNIVRLRHWGTETLVIDMTAKKVLEFYGESNSDRDSMNTMLYLTDVAGRFRYRPSVCEFTYED